MLRPAGPPCPPGEPAGTYPPSSVGVRPKSVQSPTDMSSELSTVTTAARARPHLDLTMSILPGGQRIHQGSLSPEPGSLGPVSWELGGVCLTFEEEKALVCAENVYPSQSQGTVSLKTFPGRDSVSSGRNPGPTQAPQAPLGDEAPASVTSWHILHLCPGP